jgi:hypothetical protein
MVKGDTFDGGTMGIVLKHIRRFVVFRIVRFCGTKVHF